MAKILMVLTSHDRLGDTDRQTGFFFEELAAPYWAFVDAGHEVEIASVAGGKVDPDPSSLAENEDERPESVRRFLDDPKAMAKLENTQAVGAVDPQQYDGIFLPGGHGTMWDFPRNTALAEMVSAIYDRGGVVGAVCHGPAGLVNARRPDGEPLVKGKRINGFTNAEEEAVGLADVVPFLLQSRLEELGADFEHGEPFGAHAVRDGRLVTGQNPASSQKTAELMLEALAGTGRVAAE